MITRNNFPLRNEIRGKFMIERCRYSKYQTRKTQKLKKQHNLSLKKKEKASCSYNIKEGYTLLAISSKDLTPEINVRDVNQ